MIVPTNVSLKLRIADKVEEPEYLIPRSERLFEPGKVREDDRIAARR